MEPKPTHTPEPWTVVRAYNVVVNGRTITDFYLDTPHGVTFGEQIANSARIVACVNACKGISTDDLVDIFQHMDDYRRLKALAVLANDAASDQ